MRFKSTRHTLMGHIGKTGREHTRFFDATLTLRASLSAQPLLAPRSPVLPIHGWQDRALAILLGSRAPWRSSVYPFSIIARAPTRVAAASAIQVKEHSDGKIGRCESDGQLLCNNIQPRRR